MIKKKKKSPPDVRARCDARHFSCTKSGGPGGGLSLKVRLSQDGLFQKLTDLFQSWHSCQVVHTRQLCSEQVGSWQVSSGRVFNLNTRSHRTVFFENKANGPNFIRAGNISWKNSTHQVAGHRSRTYIGSGGPPVRVGRPFSS